MTRDICTDIPTVHELANAPTADQWQAEADRLAALPVRTIAQEDGMRTCRVKAHMIRAAAARTAR